MTQGRTAQRKARAALARTLTTGTTAPAAVRTTLWVVVGLGAPALLAWACTSFESAVSSAGIALILVIPVIAVAVSGRRSAAAAAAVSAAVSFDFFYTEPRRSVAIANVNDVILVVTLLVVGLVVAQISAWGVHQRTTAHRFTNDVAILRSAAELVAIGEDDEIVAMSVAFWLRDLLQLRDCRLASDTDAPSAAQITSTGEVLVGALRWTPEHQGLPGPEIDLLLHRNAAVVGRFVLTPTPGLPVMPDRLLTATALADLIGSSWGTGRRHLETS